MGIMSRAAGYHAVPDAYACVHAFAELLLVIMHWTHTATVQIHLSLCCGCLFLQDRGFQGTQGMAALVFVHASCLRDRGIGSSMNHMACLQSMDMAYYIFEMCCMRSDEVEKASLDHYFLPLDLCCKLLSKFCPLLYARSYVTSQK
jgi:hypothetical protein